jgi:hypothetical protein
VREPVQVPFHLEGPHRELVPEHGRLRVYPVRPPDHDSAAVLQGHLAEQEGERPGFSLDEIQGLLQLQGARGIQHVGAREAEVEVARDVARVLGNGGDEGYDVVLRLPLYLVDTFDVEVRFFGELLDLFRGDLA